MSSSTRKGNWDTFITSGHGECGWSQSCVTKMQVGMWMLWKPHCGRPIPWNACLHIIWIAGIGWASEFNSMLLSRSPASVRPVGLPMCCVMWTRQQFSFLPVSKNNSFCSSWPAWPCFGGGVILGARLLVSNWDFLLLPVAYLLHMGHGMQSSVIVFSRYQLYPDGGVGILVAMESISHVYSTCNRVLCCRQQHANVTCTCTLTGFTCQRAWLANWDNSVWGSLSVAPVSSRFRSSTNYSIKLQWW